MDWRKPAHCDSSSCPAVAPYAPGLVLVRSNDRPGQVAVLSTTELVDLAIGVQRGDYADLGVAVD